MLDHASRSNIFIFLLHLLLYLNILMHKKPRQAISILLRYKA